MSRIKDKTFDPWISLEDHTDAIAAGTILYGENSYGGQHATALLNHDGADVYIRSSNKRN